MTDAAPIALTLTFTPTADGADIRWESEVMGVRSSHFASPYWGDDLPLAVRALEHAQHYGVSFSIAEIDRLAALGLADAARLVRDDAPRQIGRALYGAITADPAGAQALGTTRDNATHSGRPLALNLRFPPNAVELAALPWELLWDDGPAPLLLSRGRLAACTRHLDLPQALPPLRPGSGPLRILRIAPHADITPEQREADRATYQDAWRPLLDSGQAVVSEVSPATRQALVDAIQLNPTPDIVHYHGHGRYLRGAGALLLDRSDGGRSWTDVGALVALLGGVRLVVLQACQAAMVGAGASAAQPPEQLQERSILSGIAPALSAAGVPLVIGMQLTLRIQAAARASMIVYRALAMGRSVQDAVSQTRQALFVEEDDQASWFVPVLYVRSRDTGPAYLVESPASRPAPQSGKRAKITDSDRREAGQMDPAQSRQVLRQVLTDSFNEDELRDLCFELEIDYENLPGSTKSGKARELITYCERRARTVDLIAAVRRLRPAAPWPAAPQAAASQTSAGGPATPARPHAGGPLDLDRGLAELRARVANADDAAKAELATLEQRLKDNRGDERLFGSSENTRSGRAQIIYALNEFALAHCGVSFNELC